MLPLRDQITASLPLSPLHSTANVFEKTQIMIDIGGASSLTLSQQLSFNDIFFQCFLIYLLFGWLVCVDTFKEGCSLSIMNH